MSASIRYPLRQFLGDIWHYSAGYHRRLLFWNLIRLVTVSIALLDPVITAKIIDGITQKIPLRSVYLLALAALSIQVFRIIVRNRTKLQINRLAERIRLTLRQQSISRLLDFDLSWHENQSSGKKISIISRGADSLKGLIRFLAAGSGGIDIIINIFVVLIIFLTINPKYFLLSLLNTVFYLFAFFSKNRVINQQKHLLNIDYDRVIGKNFEYFGNIQLIKALGIGKQINSVLFLRENKFTDKSLALAKKDFDKWILINLISQFFTTATLFLIITDIFNGVITLGSYFIYTSYTNRLQDGLGSIAENADEIIDRRLGLYRLRQLLSSGTQTTNIGTKKFPQPLTDITINHLRFGYKKTGPILQDINLHLVSGQRYGLVGISGSGKSTLAKLLLKLYLPQSGSITYNRLPLNQISPDSLRENLAVVPQDSEIFNLSFKENITIASSSAKFNPALYDLAINTAECQTVVAKIKNNHQTLLGEKGIKLSGGERQRLGIARAIYKNTPIIIFDESTSSLDSKTEAKILNHLEASLSAKTILWIAHRLSTLRFTDQIIVFDRGRIVEQGSFSELIKNKSHFHELWQIQKKTKLV